MREKPQMTFEEKQRFYEDGFFVLKDVVAPELVDAALHKINNREKGTNLARDENLLNLLNASDITPILHEVMGMFDPPIACQPGILGVRQPGEHYNNLGYKDKDQPYFGAESHMDGIMTIRAPQEVQTGTPEERYARQIARGPKGDLGRSADVIGDNSVPMFEDPEMTLGLGSFTAFVFVCLNDQTVEGRGQTCLLKGAHHEMEKFFRWQRSINDCIGIEGPGWPRYNYDAPNGCGHIYLPQEIRDKFIDETSESTPDGKKWPRPTQILMDKGDACIAMYHIPHSGTRNELGTESRKNIIFRLRNKKRQPNKLVNGISDHPDRGQRGEWLEYEEGNNPWERSKDAMCNMWDEWEGMNEVVEPALAQAQA